MILEGRKTYVNKCDVKMLRLKKKNVNGIDTGGNKQNMAQLRLIFPNLDEEWGKHFILQWARYPW